MRSLSRRAQAVSHTDVHRDNTPELIVASAPIIFWFVELCSVVEDEHAAEVSSNAVSDRPSTLAPGRKCLLFFMS